MADTGRTAGSRDLFDPTIEPDARRQALRIAEAIVFAARDPVDEATIAAKLPKGTHVGELMGELARNYAGRGVELRRVAGKWMFRTAVDLADALRDDTVERRKLTRAQMETLAITAYHQPVTRAEIEDIRGVAISKGTLDVLLETGWVRMRGRRRSPGRPITYGTTEAFLIHFGLDSIQDLPGLDELKATGLIDARLPPGFAIPMPSDGSDLLPDEDPLEADATEEPLRDDEPEAEADDGEEPLTSGPFER